MGLFPKILSNEVLILYRSTDQDPEGLSAILAKAAQAAIKKAGGSFNKIERLGRSTKASDNS